MIDVFHRFYRWAVRNEWRIALVLDSWGELISGGHLRVRELDHGYDDRWFADPFIVEADRREISLLAEEYCFSDGYGRIVLLTIDRCTFRLKDRQVILDTGSHLSFPHPVDRQGQHSFIPENTACGEVARYDFSGRCLEVLHRGKIHDPILFTLSGDTYLLGTEDPDMNGSRLAVYRQTGNGFSFLKNIDFIDRSARNAGCIFWDGDRWIRPAQVCNGYYGEALSIQEVQTGPDGLLMNEVTRLYPPFPYVGMHSLSVVNDAIVVDLHAVRTNSFSRSLFALRHRFSSRQS